MVVAGGWERESRPRKKKGGRAARPPSPPSLPRIQKRDCKMSFFPGKQEVPHTPTLARTSPLELVSSEGRTMKLRPDSCAVACPSNTLSLLVHADSRNKKKKENQDSSRDPSTSYHEFKSRCETMGGRSATCRVEFEAWGLQRPNVQSQPTSASCYRSPSSAISLTCTLQPFSNRQPCLL